ncbi:carbohydrate ABC transporter membrane protein 1 (CUT1 family) [Paenibacillus taihuensis]|uniref:Carbohydrate ABC transporter membrane protein 1 (CUT1 family) n=1 Tax=Paenibacillus taihuensis TaxID=1156355 RepID=A0A3D9SBJ2_9BACL|nr:sugar ABC transporter permease [Paenibacillus taihuensis]REE90637.1 carbohydrate ABC transporter membrane protein 1 (CUT1 family) [Paenibacillus taihuensis]
MRGYKSGIYDKQEMRAAFLFILPALLLLILFIFYPMARALLISFQNYNLISANTSPAGLANYRQLFEDSSFLESLGHSFYFAAVVIPLQTVIALGLALLVRRVFRGVGLFRTVYFLPVVVSFAIASTIFKLIYNKDYGMLNVLLRGLGLPAWDFLSNPDISMIGIIILCIWKAMGFFMIVFLAGLNNIPDSLYEAAHVDGAGAVQQFFKVTLPLLKRTTAFVIIITTMDALKIFVPIYITTSGGPAQSTSTVVFYIYETAFKQMNMGYASAAAFVLFAIVLVISVIQLRLFRTDVEY